MKAGDVSSRAMTDWIPLVIIVIAVLGAAALSFFAVAALLDPARLLPVGSELTDGVRTFAEHIAVRNVAIVLLIGVALVRQERRVLAFLLGLLGVVQALDAVLGARAGQLVQTVVPALLALVFLAAASYLLRNRS